MSSKNSKFRMASISDIHLGHSTTPTTHILKNLEKAFLDTAETAELDMITFGGDLFDTLLMLPNEDVNHIKIWAVRFLRMCARNDIVVVLLEGTPSHDWKQNKLLVELNELLDIGADVRYIQTLSIVYFERFGLHFLYVPDEWRPDPNQTWNEVVELLQKHGIEKVDYAIMHGFFPHQMPKQLIDAAHDPDRYLSIVREVIFIGHIHLYSQYERIYSNGSFDRLAHGEEGPKGHLRLLHDKRGNHITFVENKGAMIYKTVDVRGMDTEELHKKVEKALSEVPIGSPVRLWMEKGDIASGSLKWYKENYPGYRWSTKIESGPLKQAEDFELPRRQEMVKVTKDNIVPLLMERIRSRHPEKAERCERYLRGVVHGDASGN